MARKTTWKMFSFTNPNEYYRLQASISGLPAARKYSVLFHGNIEGIETNLPYSELRAWFRHSDVPLRDQVTDIMTLEERVKEWEAEDAAKAAALK